MPPAPSVRRAVAGKARVHELAKELGVTSKEVLKKLADLGEYVKSASSTVEAPVARKLRDSFPSDAGMGSQANGTSAQGRGSGSGSPGAHPPAGPGTPRPGPAPARRPASAPDVAAAGTPHSTERVAQPPLAPERPAAAEQRVVPERPAFGELVARRDHRGVLRWIEHPPVDVSSTRFCDDAEPTSAPADETPPRRDQ